MKHLPASTAPAYHLHAWPSNPSLITHTLTHTHTHTHTDTSLTISLTHALTRYDLEMKHLPASTAPAYHLQAGPFVSTGSKLSKVTYSY